MKRNIEQQIEFGEKNLNIRRDLTVSEIKKIMELSYDKDIANYVFNAISNAFMVGYAQGIKEEKNKKNQAVQFGENTAR